VKFVLVKLTSDKSTFLIKMALGKSAKPENTAWLKSAISQGPASENAR
jgi:hypothetical protein